MLYIECVLDSTRTPQPFAPFLVTGECVDVSRETPGARYISASIKIFHAHGKTTSGIDCETANVLSAIRWGQRAENHIVGRAFNESLGLELIYRSGAAGYGYYPLPG